MRNIDIMIVIALSLLFCNCKHEPTYIIKANIIGATKNNPVPTEICLNTKFLPLITASCAQLGCHSIIIRKESLTLNSYSEIMKIGINDLLKYIKLTSGKVMPTPPQPRKEQVNINLIQHWINEGTKNTICNLTQCNTANAKYSTRKAAVMNTYCKNCHNAANKGGDVNLDSFLGVKRSTQVGKLLCTITASKV
jgi:hypothetical protein